MVCVPLFAQSNMLREKREKELLGSRSGEIAEPESLQLLFFANFRPITLSGFGFILFIHRTGVCREIGSLNCAFSWCGALLRVKALLTDWFSIPKVLQLFIGNGISIIKSNYCVFVRLLMRK
jgi:hypothetical protein